MLIQTVKRLVPRRFHPRLGRVFWPAYQAAEATRSMPRRLRTAWSYYADTAREIVSWTLRSRETSNFTYDLTERNKRHLAAFVAAAVGVPIAMVQSYISELETDAQLREHVRAQMR